MFVDVQSRNISYDFEGFDEDNIINKPKSKA